MSLNSIIVRECSTFCQEIYLERQFFEEQTISSIYYIICISYLTGCGATNSRIAIVYNGEEGELNTVADTVALQLFQPQLNSNIQLYRYHLPDNQITVKVERTIFSHSKVNQWSRIQSANTNVTNLLPFITMSLTHGSYQADTNFGLILLLKHKSTNPSILQDLFNSKHTYLKGVNLYIVSVGVTSNLFSVDYRDMFPAGTKYANIRDINHVAIYSMDIFNDICPGRYRLRKLAHATYRNIFGCKNENFHSKKHDIFLIFAQNIDCGYTLEPSRRGGY